MTLPERSVVKDCYGSPAFKATPKDKERSVPTFYRCSSSDVPFMALFHSRFLFSFFILLTSGLWLGETGLFS